MTFHCPAQRRTAAILTLIAASLVAPLLATPALAETPETVMVTLHAKPGSEEPLAKVLAQHWETARRLNLVAAAPHLTVRATELGQDVFCRDLHVA